jgi:hypothetical protein
MRTLRKTCQATIDAENRNAPPCTMTTSNQRSRVLPAAAHPTRTTARER